MSSYVWAKRNPDFGSGIGPELLPLHGRGAGAVAAFDTMSDAKSYRDERAAGLCALPADEWVLCELAEVNPISHLLAMDDIRLFHRVLGCKLTPNGLVVEGYWDQLCELELMRSKLTRYIGFVRAPEPGQGATGDGYREQPFAFVQLYVTPGHLQLVQGSFQLDYVKPKRLNVPMLAAYLRQKLIAGDYVRCTSVDAEGEDTPCPT